MTMSRRRGQGEAGKLCGVVVGRGEWRMVDVVVIAWRSRMTTTARVRLPSSCLPNDLGSE